MFLHEPASNFTASLWGESKKNTRVVRPEAVRGPRDPAEHGK